jgi:hypothetical protein
MTERDESLDSRLSTFPTANLARPSQLHERTAAGGKIAPFTLRPAPRLADLLSWDGIPPPSRDTEPSQDDRAI